MLLCFHQNKHIKVENFRHTRRKHLAQECIITWCQLKWMMPAFKTFHIHRTKPIDSQRLVFAFHIARCLLFLSPSHSRLLRWNHLIIQFNNLRSFCLSFSRSSLSPNAAKTIPRSLPQLPGFIFSMLLNCSRENSFVPFVIRLQPAPDRYLAEDIKSIPKILF